MKRSRVVGAVLFLALCAASVAVLFLTPPRSVVRAIAVSSSTSLLDWSGTRWERAGRKLLSGWLQIAVASHVAKRVLPPAASEEQALADIITFVQKSSVNQTQYEHIPKLRPVLLTGLGFCDQINAAVGTIAVHRFPRVELYGLYDPQTKTSPHSIGRVWSRARNDWIYYDAFFDVPVLFTKGKDGKPNFLGPLEVDPTPSRGAPRWDLYHLPGWTYADSRPTFAGLLASRAELWRSPYPQPELDAAKNPGAPEDPVRALALLLGHEPPANRRVFRRLARQYMAVRMDQLLTGRVDAKRYRAIARNAAAARDYRAAEIEVTASHLAEVAE